VCDNLCKNELFEGALFFEGNLLIELFYLFRRALPLEGALTSLLRECFLSREPFHSFWGVLPFFLGSPSFLLEEPFLVGEFFWGSGGSGGSGDSGGSGGSEGAATKRGTAAKKLTFIFLNFFTRKTCNQQLGIRAGECSFNINSNVELRKS
jgi:hypothetical protein